MKVDKNAIKYLNAHKEVIFHYLNKFDSLKPFVIISQNFFINILRIKPFHFFMMGNL